MENEEKSVVAESPAEYGKIDVIAEWKRRKAEEKAWFAEWIKSDEYKKIHEELKVRNAAKGIIIP